MKNWLNICRAAAALSLLAFAGCDRPAALTFKKDERGYLLTEGDKPVLFFQVAPKTINGKFERAGYVHPLYDWEGNELTQDGPPDHPHHRGIFWAWHQVLWRGISVGDGWVSDKIRFVPGDNRITSDKKSVTIQSELQWVADSIDAEDKALVKEQVKIRAHESGDGYRLIDFSISLFPLKDSVAIGGSNDVKGYGGFSTRWKLPEDLQFFSGDSILQPRETAVTGAPWISFTGTFNGNAKQAITLFCKEAYPGPTQSWILRGPKDMSMQNALFPGKEPVMIGKDGLKLRYRIVVQETPLSNKEIDELFNSYQKEADI